MRLTGSEGAGSMYTINRIHFIGEDQSPKTGGADASCIFECCMFLSERIPVSYNHRLGPLCIWPGGGGSKFRRRSERSCVGCCDHLSLLVIPVLALRGEMGQRRVTEQASGGFYRMVMMHSVTCGCWYLLVLTSRWQQGLTTRERLCSSVYLTFLQQHGWGHKTLVSSATKRRGCSSKQGSKYVFGMDAKCSGHKLWKKLGADILI